MLSVAEQCSLLFVAIGAAEAVAGVLTWVATKHLPDAVLPLLGQFVIIWNFLLSVVIPGRRFHISELLGVLLMMAGVVLSSQAPSGASAASLASGIFAQVDFRYAWLFVASCALPVAATIVKKRIFRVAKERLQGQPLDIVVVNTMGSWARMIGTLLLLPILAAQQNIAMPGLPSYLAEISALVLLGLVAYHCLKLVPQQDGETKLA